MVSKEFPITGRVWFRESTNEWVLELSGEINDTFFTCRHSQPADIAPEYVPGLPALYQAEIDYHKALKWISDGASYAHRSNIKSVADSALKNKQSQCSITDAQVGDLDTTIPNNFDPTKRGFVPK